MFVSIRNTRLDDLAFQLDMLGAEIDKAYIFKTNKNTEAALERINHIRAEFHTVKKEFSEIKSELSDKVAQAMAKRKIDPASADA